MKERMKTVGDIIQQLSIYDKGCDLSFSGLNFYQIKQRGENLVQIEFDEAVYRDDKGQVHITNFPE